MILLWLQMLFKKSVDVFIHHDYDIWFDVFSIMPQRGLYAYDFMMIYIYIYDDYMEIYVTIHMMITYWFYDDMMSWGHTVMVT